MERDGATHSIILCTRCRVLGREAWAGLQARLRGRLGDAGGSFAIAGVRCLAGCGRPLAVGFCAPGKASFLFGDIDARRDADALGAFAELYRSLPDGWCSEGERPAGLRGKIIARIPAPLGSPAP